MGRRARAFEVVAVVAPPDRFGVLFGVSFVVAPLFPRPGRRASSFAAAVLPARGAVSQSARQLPVVDDDGGPSAAEAEAVTWLGVVVRAMRDKPPPNPLLLGDVVLSLDSSRVAAGYGDGRRRGAGGRGGRQV